VNPKLIRYAEWIVAVFISATVLFVFFVRATHAGALWRDECDSMALARLPSFADVLHNLKFTSFPVLFPTTIRVFTNLFGTSDASMRWFSFLVGAALVAVAWFNARTNQRDVPLILPALAGLNLTFLVDGTWIRGYGLGSVLLVFALGLTALFVARPTIIRLVAMFLCDIACMQCLYFDAALVPALLLAAFAICVFRRQFEWALALCGVAAICALSYIPKFFTYFEIRDWAGVLQCPIAPIELWREFRLACGEPASVALFMWLAILSFSILGAAWVFLKKWRGDDVAESNLLVFGALTILIAGPIYFIFLWTLHNLPETRYYLALLCLFAAAADLVVGRLSRFVWVRCGRLFVVIGLAASLPIFAWPKILERNTSIDLLARGLERYARAEDLIVVNPWFLAPSFSRYYHGQVRWMTVPELSEKRIHRYDLMKAKMEMADGIDDLRSAISQTLQAGNRVWLVGGAQPSEGKGPLSLTAAPDPQFGWSGQAYTYAWSNQLGAFLREHVADGEIVVGQMNGVNSHEDIPLLIARGWRD
jgi:hypothetical protein